MDSYTKKIYNRHFSSSDQSFEQEENLWNNFYKHKNPSLNELQQIALNGGYDLKEKFQAWALAIILSPEEAGHGNVCYSILASLPRKLVYFAYDLIIEKMQDNALTVIPPSFTRHDWQQQLFWLGLSLARVNREIHPEERKVLNLLPKHAWCSLINTAVNLIPDFSIRDTRQLQFLRPLIDSIGADDILAQQLAKIIENFNEDKKMHDAETNRLISLMSYS